MTDPAATGDVWAWIIANYHGLLVTGQGSIILGAAVGLGLAARRIRVANRQTITAQETAEAAAQQATAAVRQADVAERGNQLTTQNLVDRQFQAGVKLLGNESMTIRLGGVTVLTDMMQIHPHSHHVRVMRLCVAFLTYPPRLPDTKRIDLDSPDILENVPCSTRQEKKSESLRKQITSIWKST